MNSNQPQIHTADPEALTRELWSRGDPTRLSSYMFASAGVKVDYLPDLDTRFDPGTRVIHHGTHDEYEIVLPPEVCTLEHSWEPAYGYAKVVDGVIQMPLIFRAKSEMEDGRFKRVVRGALARTQA